MFGEQFPSKLVFKTRQKTKLEILALQLQCGGLMSLVRIADLIEERDDGGVLIFPRLFFWKVRDMSGSLLSLLFNDQKKPTLLTLI